MYFLPSTDKHLGWRVTEKDDKFRKWRQSDGPIRQLTQEKTQGTGDGDSRSLKV